MAAAEPLLRVRVAGEPASFATSREVAWREQVAVALAEVPFDPAGTVLSLDLVASPEPGLPFGPGLDDLCEPVIAAAVGRLGWFGGKRPNIKGLWARKRIGPRVGVDIAVFSSWMDVSVGDVPVLLDATYPGEPPRSGRDLEFAQWVGRELRALPSPGSRVAVRLAYAGRMNIADVSTGRLKSTIDCLWPVLGGTPGAPDDGRVTILAATQGEGMGRPGVRVTVMSQGQTRPVGVN
ncbi:MAG: hypothetical protein U0869_26355 [Chloroflexota bacterium]